LQVLLTSRGSAIEGELKEKKTGLPIDATVYVFSRGSNVVEPVVAADDQERRTAEWAI
jgi:hypothetical protein